MTFMQGNKASNRHEHVRPSIQQHKDLLLDKRYHHKAEVSRRMLLKSQQDYDLQQQIKDYLNERN
jgi:hypothetical protein